MNIQEPTSNVTFCKFGSVVYASIRSYSVSADETGTQYMNIRIPNGYPPRKVCNATTTGGKRIMFHTSGVIEYSGNSGDIVNASATWII